MPWQDPEGAKLHCSGGYDLRERHRGTVGREKERERGESERGEGV